MGGRRLTIATSFRSCGTRYRTVTRAQARRPSVAIRRRRGSASGERHPHQRAGLDPLLQRWESRPRGATGVTTTPASVGSRRWIAPVRRPTRTSTGAPTRSTDPIPVGLGGCPQPSSTELPPSMSDERHHNRRGIVRQLGLERCRPEHRRRPHQCSLFCWRDRFGHPHSRRDGASRACMRWIRGARRENRGRCVLR